MTTWELNHTMYDIFNKMIILRLLVIISFCFLPIIIFSSEPRKIDFEDSIHQYFETTPNDPFSLFKKKVENGDVKLNYNSEKKYLF